MKFAILINSAPYTCQSAETAYHFVLAALNKGHQVPRIFFYMDGVHNGSAFITAPQDETQMVERWSSLAAKYDIDLVLCIAAAQRRGLVDAGEAARHSKSGSNLAAGFRLSGLGQLMEMSIESDRLMVFGESP